MQQHIQGEFDYQTVQLIKTEWLGTGSYGVLYKARCTDIALTCACKILRPNFFNSEDEYDMKRFEQECSFLKTIRHPNIVQYLGTSKDPETQLTMLVMELMDENLTQFLEQSHEPLAYYIQVNLCHDIALALTYLHSKDIIHRDLSSNNVLLIGAGIRAKVTDFGMAKKFDENCTTTTPLTSYPGTLPYMPPEALDHPPVYTKQLDCFSFGVLDIQIITRQYPRPGPRMKRFHDPHNPKLRLHEDIPETKRRKSQIDLIDSTHPLLAIATDCLSDEDRPSAQDLCHDIAILKKATRYIDSVQQAQERRRPAESTRDDGEARERHIGKLQKKLQHLEKETEKLRQKYDSQLQEKNAILAARQQEIQQLQALNQQLETGKRQLQIKGRAFQQKEKLTLDWKKYKPALCIMRRGSAAVRDSIAYFRPFGSTQVQSYNSITKKWSLLPECPIQCVTLTVVNDLLTAAGGVKLTEYKNTLYCLVEEGGRKEWVEHLIPPMPTERRNPAIVCNGKALVVAGGTRDLDTKMATVEVMDTETLRWSSACSLPHPLSDVSATICEGRIYLMGVDAQNNQSVLTCSLSDLLGSRTAEGKTRAQQVVDVWHMIEDLPVKCSTFVTLDEQLLAVGGKDLDGKETNNIYTYNTVTNSWEIISQMPTSRHTCLVTVLPGNRLMVVGGQTAQISELNDVEIATVL